MAVSTQNLPEGRVSAVDHAGGLVALLGVTGLAGLLGWLFRRRPAWLAATIMSQASLAGLLWLFRNPVRHTPQGAGVVVTPCDGVVTQINLVQAPAFLNALAYRVAIRVSLGDVQVVRAPAQGTIRLRRYQPETLSDEPNDALWIGIRQSSGAKVLQKLIASSLWRPLPNYWAHRIVYSPDLEDAVQTGQIVGHLPLGGEVHVYVPASARIAVEPGVRVRSGESVLARL